MKRSWKDNFLPNMNPRYFHVFLGWRIGLFKGERLREGELKEPVEHKEWKISVLLCSSLRPNFSRRDEMIW